MRYSHSNQNVQLSTQELMIVTEVTSDFEQLIDGMQGLVGSNVIVYDAETHCWWDRAVKQPAKLQDLWAVAHGQSTGKQK
jgi:hypothetical protein